MNVKYDALPGHFPKPQTQDPPAHIRPANVFHGLPLYPVPPSNGIPSLPPQLHGSMDARLGGHVGSTIPASTTMPTSLIPGPTTPEIGASPPAGAQKHRAPPPPPLPNIVPEAKKRKLFTMRDPENNNPVRVKINLEGVNLNEMPDSYRRDNSVYPRAFFPVEMKLSPGARKSKRREGRFFDEEDNEEDFQDGGGVGRTMVRVPMIEGEGEVPVPRLGKREREKEEMLNDLGYRICWGHRRSFARRILLIQQTCKPTVG